MTAVRRLAAAGAAWAVVLAGGCGSQGAATGSTPSTTTTVTRPVPAPTGGPSGTPGTGPSGHPTVADGAADRPQTGDLPGTEDPAFQLRVQGLWRAIVDDDPETALAFFFPLGAYQQVKAISDPVGDYQTRLIAAYRSDIQALDRVGALTDFGIGSDLGDDPRYGGRGRTFESCRAHGSTTPFSIYLKPRNRPSTRRDRSRRCYVFA